MVWVEAETTRQNIKQNREVMRRDAEIRNQELQRMGYSFENGQMNVRPDSAAEAEQLQYKQTAQLAKTLQGKLAAQDTDMALEDFALSGDATALQRALDNNPYLKQAWGEKGVQLVNNLDFTNDAKLLSQAGVKPSAYDTPEKQDIVRKNMYKYYNGKEWALGLLNNAAMETGAIQRLGTRRGQAILDNTKQLRELMNGPKASGLNASGHKYEKEINAAAAETGLPPDLIAAMTAVESSNDPKAVSPKGATGLMQLMEDAAAEVGVTDRLDPAQNILGGAKYLKKQLDANGGDLSLALAAYNAGPGNVQKYGGVPPFGETQDYIKKVMGNLERSQSYYGSRADTILDHLRGQANAAAGKTNAQSDQESALALVGAQQNQRQLDQADTKIGQTDQELALKARAQDIELRAQDIKLKTEGTTGKQKDLAAAVTETENLLENFGGEDNFFATDFKDAKAYRDAYKHIVAIEQLEGTELSEADKKNITDVRRLISLGDPAAKLTPADTGLLDSNLKTLNKYFSDNVKGVEASSSYAAFRNSLRNALYGSALTPGEIKSFDQAYGKLGNKLGPVLEQFKTALVETEAKLNSTANLMNPYSAKVRLGADQEKMQSIITALQERIAYIEGVSNGKNGEDAVRKAFEE